MLQLCSWAQHLCKHGHVANVPSQYPLEKASLHLEHLETVRDLLLNGHEEDGVGGMAYRDLYEFKEDHPHELDVAMGVLKCTTLESFWVALQRIFPGLMMKKLRVKKCRDATRAGNAAQQLLGDLAMIFDKTHCAKHPWTRRVLQEAYEYLYQYEQLLHNIFGDAGKIEPNLWLATQRVISHLGKCTTAATYALLNKQVPG